MTSVRFGGYDDELGTLLTGKIGGNGTLSGEGGAEDHVTWRFEGFLRLTILKTVSVGCITLGIDLWQYSSNFHV